MVLSTIVSSLFYGFVCLLSLHFIGHHHASARQRRTRGKDQGQHNFILTIVVNVLELIVGDITVNSPGAPVFQEAKAVPAKVINLGGSEEFDVLEKR